MSWILFVQTESPAISSSHSLSSDEPFSNSPYISIQFFLVILLYLYFQLSPSLPSRPLSSYPLPLALPIISPCSLHHYPIIPTILLHYSVQSSPTLLSRFTHRTSLFPSSRQHPEWCRQLSPSVSRRPPERRRKGAAPHVNGAIVNM